MTNREEKEGKGSGAQAAYLASAPELEWYIEADVAECDLIGSLEGKGVLGFGELTL